MRFLWVLVVLVVCSGAALAQETPPTPTLINYAPHLDNMYNQIRSYMEQFLPFFTAVLVLVYGPRLFVKMIDMFLK